MGFHVAGPNYFILAEPLPDPRRVTRPPEGWSCLSISVFLMYVCQITLVFDFSISVFYFSISVFYFSMSVLYFSILLQYFSVLLQCFASVNRGQVHTYHKQQLSLSKATDTHNNHDGHRWCTLSKPEAYGVVS